MQNEKILTAGKPLAADGKALIMLHGRGATAADILSLANYLNVSEFALFAPQAANFSWYPHSFLAPRQNNEPWLTNSLTIVHELVLEIVAAGLTRKQIFFTGFSQGACLTLEYVTRNAQRYGGIAVFTGGLIGDRLYTESYSGDFNQTPFFIGTSDPDPHVPVKRVIESKDLLERMGAHVTTKVYNNIGHTITNAEIEQANTLIFNTRN